MQVAETLKLYETLVKALKRSEFIALPNILADRRLVPEILQYEATPEALADAVVTELERSTADPDYLAPFAEHHRILRRDASARAAAAVLELVDRR